MDNKVVSLVTARSPEAISGNFSDDDESFNHGSGGGGDDMLEARVASDSV